MQDDLRFYVYAYYEPGSDKPFYIGKGCDDRYREHIRPYELRKRDRFHSKLRGMLCRRIAPDVKFLGDYLSHKDAMLLEIRLIKQYGRLDTGTGCLTNATDGGEGQYGRVCSEETRRRMSVTRKGRPVSEAAKKKIGNAHRGRKMPREAVEKARETKRKNPMSAEGRAALREARKSKARAVVKIDPLTDAVVGTYRTVYEAGYKNTSNIYRVLAGENVTAYGFKWKFLDSPLQSS